MHGTQVGVFEEVGEVGFSGFLQGKNGRRLESEFWLPLVGNFPDQSLEGELPDEEISGPLVLPDFPEDGSSGWPESVFEIVKPYSFL